MHCCLTINTLHTLDLLPPGNSVIGLRAQCIAVRFDNLSPVAKMGAPFASGGSPGQPHPLNALTIRKAAFEINRNERFFGIIFYSAQTLDICRPVR